MMEKSHMIIMSFAILGLVIGGVLIDLDHTGTWDCKWRKFWHRGEECSTGRGFTHNPVFMLSVAWFCILFGSGILARRHIL